MKIGGKISFEIGVSGFAWTTTLTEKHLALLPLIREQGLTSFEVAMFDPASLPTVALRRALEANDLAASVCLILPPGSDRINPISPDASVRKAALAHLIRCIETAAESGARLVCGPVYAPIGYLPGRRRSADEWSWAVEAMQGLGDVLKALQCTLAVEPVNRSETFLLNTAAEAMQLCEAVNHLNIGVTLDTFHANIEEKNIAAAVQSLGHHLKHLHASENDRGLLGSGHVDFAAIVQALRQIDYRGCLMIEGFGYSADEPNSLGALWGDTDVTPEDIAFKGADYLRCLKDDR